MKIIERKQYLKCLISVIGTPDIKIIIGVRRSGKSKLMKAFIEYIEKNVDDVNIIHMDFNLTKFEKQKDYHELEAYIENKYDKVKKNFILIDEVQNCPSFELAINSLHASEKYDIYLTGSNAFLLSSDLATLFTGRTFEIEIFPFSFKEYLLYHGEKDLDKDFLSYVRYGGMAGSYVYESEENKYKYLSNIFNTLIVRDLVQKYNIKNKNILDSLVNYMLDNISNLTSIKSITDTLVKNKTLTTDKTIGGYIKYLCNAFAFYKIRRYDINGKKYLASSEKYYLVDPTFKYAILGTKNLDTGRIYENLVALELKRRGYELCVGVLYKKEIDFVAIKRNEKIYIQVCDDISNEITFKREIDSLLAIKDAYPKVLIARTKHETYTYEGIKIIDIANWLLEVD